MRYRMFLMSAITHLFRRRKIHNTNNRKQKARAVLEVEAFWVFLPPSFFPGIFAIALRGLGWQKFTVEIKNNAFQNDTLNTERRQSGDNSSIWVISQRSWGGKETAEVFVTVRRLFLNFSLGNSSQLASNCSGVCDEHHSNSGLCNSNLEGSICHSAAIHPSDGRRRNFSIDFPLLECWWRIWAEKKGKIQSSHEF